MNSLVTPNPLPTARGSWGGGRSAASAYFIYTPSSMQQLQASSFFSFQNDESELIHSYVFPKHSRKQLCAYCRETKISCHPHPFVLLLGLRLME